MIETGRKKEKVILVAAALDDLEKAEQSLDELGELVKTDDPAKRRGSPGDLYRKREARRVKVACMGKGSGRHCL